MMRAGDSCLDVAGGEGRSTVDHDTQIQDILTLGFIITKNAKKCELFAVMSFIVP